MIRIGLKAGVLAVSLSASLLVGSLASAEESSVSPAVSVNGKAIVFQYGAPFIEDGNSLAPLRDILTNLGVPDDDSHIVWDGADQSVTVHVNGITVELKVGDSVVLRNNEKFAQLELAPRMVGDRVYLPIRAVAEALGFKVGFDAATLGITLDLGQPPSTGAGTEHKPDASGGESKPTTPAQSADTAPPTIIEAKAEADGTSVLVLFSEKMDKQSAEQASNYKLAERYGNRSDLEVKEATLQGDGTIVKLTTGPQQGAVLYGLEIKDVKDLAGIAIVTPTNYTFVGMQGSGTPSTGQQPPGAPEDPDGNLSFSGAISESSNTVTLLFSTKLDTGLAEQLSRYSIKESYGNTSVAIKAAQLLADGRSVKLTIDGTWKTNTLYNVTVQDLKSDLGKALTNSPDSKTFVGAAGQESSNATLLSFDAALSQSNNTVTLYFSNKLDKMIAEQIGHYAIVEKESNRSVTIKTAELLSDNKSVKLTIDGNWQAPAVYIVTAEGLKSIYGSNLSNSPVSKMFAGTIVTP